MSDRSELFRRAAEIAAAFRASAADRPVGRSPDLQGLRAGLHVELPERRSEPVEVLEALAKAADPGLVATVGPRYFGFVVGGALDAATAADMVAAGWDQNGFSPALSPAAMVAEEAAGTWLKELLGLPATASVGFATGTQQANTILLAAARQQVLADRRWDVGENGLRGAPPVRVLAGTERHATIDRSLRLLGIGTTAVEEVPTDGNGAVQEAEMLERLRSNPSVATIVCLQAGNVNTGAIDPMRRICEAAKAAKTWVHVDGAFGLWAGASPQLKHLVDGVELADSWSCDGHKWLNVPYDSGYAFCAHPQIHSNAVGYNAAYLVGAGGATLGDLVLDSSRRARGFSTWAAIQELGRFGIADMIERSCALARRFAATLGEGGAEIHNEVVLNQVLVGFGSDARTEAVIKGVQEEGTCWLGGTTWRGKRLIRISVSNWSTTEEDVDRSASAILQVARTL
ncbi:MAG: aspartate aminotransferase family protein [Acidimicrobiia bacterium]|nr:aspartate aminotransferase family protein [Acidimicrobiia bacterium]